MTKAHAPIEGFIGVFIALVIIFLISPLFLTNFYAHTALQFSFLLLILSTIYSVSNRPLAVILGVIAACFTIICYTIDLFYPVSYFFPLAYIFNSLFIFVAIICLVKRVFKESVIDTNLLFGVITIYLLAGILWGKLYFLIDYLFANSFHGLSAADDNFSLIGSYNRQFDLIYFSYATLSTLGEGDILPIHHLAKSLTLLEAIFGQLFVAIVIAKMVSVWRHNPR